MARPKVYTKETQPYSLTIRIPRELFNQMERYTGSEGRSRTDRSRTDAIVEGLKLWLARQEASGALAHDSNNAVMHELNTPAHFLDDGIPFDDERLPVLIPENAATEGKLSDNNMSTGSGAARRQGRKRQASVSANVTDTVTVTGHAPEPFDTAKFYLGKLCPKGHEFGGTGQSLLRKHKQSCRECENESKRDKRAREKEAREAQPVAG